MQNKKINVSREGYKMSFANVARNQPNLTRTENNAVAMKSTGSALVDLFGTIGALRQKDDEYIIQEFNKAQEENFLLATKMLFYARNVRGGLGERRTFRIILRHLAFFNPDVVIKNLSNIPLFGRWDDLYSLFGTPVQEQMWELIRTQLIDDLNAMNSGRPCSIMAKWLKSVNASSHVTRNLGHQTALNVGLSDKDYRKLLSDLRRYIDVPERKMSGNDWTEINYPAVSSGAMKNYRKAFGKHDPEGFSEFIGNVEKGVEKIKASTLFPSDIMVAGGLVDNYNRCLSFRKDAVLEAQWKALPNYVEGNNNVLIMADTSGSMRGLPMATSVGLAVYFAERNKGAYHNLFLTFSERPMIVELKGNTLKEKIESIQSLNVANTDLETAFNLILNIATENDIPQEDLPVSLVIISDMEFDEASAGHATVTFFESMKKKFRNAGYEMPNVVFWNAEERNKSFQAKLDTRGVQLFSGHSASSFRDVVNSIGMTPYEAMLKALSNPMYDVVKV
jgi:hypothetical protein